MKNLQSLSNEIFKITNKIETNYPELYQFLDENPITIPSEKNPNIDKMVLQEYLESLKLLLKHHLETYKTIK